MRRNFFFFNHDESSAEKIIEHEDSKERGCVYLIRNKDIHKIGTYENVFRRLGQLKSDEVVNIVKFSNYRSL